MDRDSSIQTCCPHCLLVAVILTLQLPDKPTFITDVLTAGFSLSSSLKADGDKWHTTIKLPILFTTFCLRSSVFSLLLKQRCFILLRQVFKCITFKSKSSILSSSELYCIIINQLSLHNKPWHFFKVSNYSKPQSDLFILI